MSNARDAACSHDVRGCLRGHHDERGVWFWIDFVDARKGREARHFGGFRMDWDDLVAARLELLHHQAAEVIGISGGSDERDTLLFEELLDGFPGLHVAVERKERADGRVGRVR